MKRMQDGSSGSMKRRQFIARTGAVLGAAALTGPRASAQGKIRLGLIGCGNRGQWLADLFRKHGGYQITAGADYFQDRLDTFSAEFNVPKNLLFAGLSGYLKLLDSGAVDAVAIESPPYFHPEQAAAAVAAGKHVYLAKPIAVDVSGCKTVEACGEEGRKKGLCVLVDFQTRADVFFQEAMRRVHAGALGTLSFGESSYHASIPFQDMHHYLEEDAKNPENRLRAWGVDRVLSGDIITEQNIHTIDVASWIMDSPPVSAVGTSSQKVRLLGDCNDHFSVIFQYPDGVDVSFTSRQFPAFGTKPDGIRNRMFGTKGVLETSYGGEVLIRGDESSFYRGGSSPGIYQDGAVANIATFHARITARQFDNETVAPSVRSNLMTILGRTAAYEQRKVTWKELLEMKKPLKWDLAGLKA